MLQFVEEDVRVAPFPHAYREGVLPPEMFARLKADFPVSSFEAQQELTGSTGSRVGKGTGFDIYRGDREYDRLIESSDAWAEFDRHINSPEFVENFLRLFGSHLAEAGLGIEIDPERYDRAFVEGRDVLTTKPSLGERWRGFVSSIGIKTEAAPTLFTRLDIERSLKGYAKPPHCDRANRVASLIVYFTNQDEVGLRGGELNIYKHKVAKPIEKYERHPKPDDVDIVATLPVRENLGVFFPCSNNSYHGVNAVTTPGIPRDFLYINISADTASCWR